MEWLIAARFVMGVGLGAEIVVGYVTLSEFVPPLQRGRWGSALSAITNSALFVSAFAGLLIIPQFGWRWMFVITGIGALIVWYLRRALPESPRWLESKGHTEEAEKVLAAIEAEVSQGRPLPPAADQATPIIPRQSIKALFEGAMLSRTIVGSLILIAINTVIYGFVAWVPTFLVKQGMSIVSSLGFTTLMSLGGPVGALAGMWLGDHVGRKPVLVGFSLATIVLGFIYPYAPSDALLRLVGFALVTCVYVMVAVAWALYVPELFPTEIRMRGAGFCNTMGRLMTIVTPQIVPVIFVKAGVVGVVTMLAALLLIQAIAVAFFGIETRQQSLEALRPATSRLRGDDDRCSGAALATDLAARDEVGSSQLARQADHRLGETRNRSDHVVERHFAARRFADDGRQHVHVAPEQRIERGERVAQRAAIGAGDQDKRQAQRHHHVEDGAVLVQRLHDAADAFDQQDIAAALDRIFAIGDDGVDVDAAPFKPRCEIGRQGRPIAPRRRAFDRFRREWQAKRGDQRARIACRGLRRLVAADDRFDRVDARGRAAANAG